MAEAEVILVIVTVATAVVGAIVSRVLAERRLKKLCKKHQAEMNQLKNGSFDISESTPIAGPARSKSLTAKLLSAPLPAELKLKRKRTPSDR